MVTTVPTDTEGGSSQAKKSSAKVKPGLGAAAQFGDHPPLSNSAAGSTRSDSTSPFNSLRKFAGTPQQEEPSARDASNSGGVMPGDESGLGEEPNMDEVKPEPAPPRQRHSPRRDPKAREARSKMAMDEPEDCGQLVKPAGKKKEVSVPREPPTATSKDGIQDNIRAKYGSVIVEELDSKEQNKCPKPSDAVKDKKRAKSAHQAEKKVTRFADQEEEKGRARSAVQAEECSQKAGGPSRRCAKCCSKCCVKCCAKCCAKCCTKCCLKCNVTCAGGHEIEHEVQPLPQGPAKCHGPCMQGDAKDGGFCEEKRSPGQLDLDCDEEKASSGKSEECLVPVIKMEEVNPGCQDNPDPNIEASKPGCPTTLKSYQQLGQCLRANTFPGIPVPMKSVVQETYTNEVNQKGKVEKLKSHHWHGKKTDELGLSSQGHGEEAASSAKPVCSTGWEDPSSAVHRGHWHERNFSNLNLQRALEEKNKDKLQKN